MRSILALVALTGCFNPKFQSGVPCSEDRQCPGDQICAADDRCYAPGEGLSPDAGVDGPDDVLRVVEIAAGGSASPTIEHTCALLSDGQVRCFGSNLVGQLGLANAVPFGDNEPANNAPFIDLPEVKAIGLGFDSTCAIFADSTIRCWGSNEHGELGLGNSDTSPIGDDELPKNEDPIDIGGDAEEVCGADTYQCVRFATGGVRCFGLETNTASGGSALGIPGVSQIGLDDVPSQFAEIDLGSPVTDIDCGFLHACAVNDAGSVICWGVSSNGQLGYPGVTGSGFDNAPVNAGFVDIGGTVSQVAAGERHTCALLESGAVRCWGQAESLGISASEDIGDDEAPSAAGFVELGESAVELKANGGMTCARLESGDVRCWGFPNGHAAAPVGDNEAPTAFTPLPFPSPSVGIGVGFQHACAVLENNEVYCWGEGEAGSLGYGDTDDVGIGTSVTSKGPVPIN